MRPPQLLFRWVSLRGPSSGQHLHSNYELKETILLYHGHFRRGTCSCLPTMQIKKELCPTEFHNTLLQIIQRKMSKYHWMPNKIWKKKTQQGKKKCHTEILPKIIFPFETEWMVLNSSEDLLHKSWNPSTHTASQVSYNAFTPAPSGV